jgi:hypothetical protein
MYKKQIDVILTFNKPNQELIDLLMTYIMNIFSLIRNASNREQSEMIMKEVLELSKAVAIVEKETIVLGGKNK